MSFSSFDTKQLTGRIGAEILGLNLSANLSDEVIAEIREALVRYKVIFFRNQTLDGPGQIAFARRFGELTKGHPTLPTVTDQPEILDLDYGRTATRANNWHTDVTFVDRPPLGSILRTLELPSTGGDTLWANTVAAYQDLPAPLRALADQLWAVHTNDYDYIETASTLSEAEASEYHKTFISTLYETLHPVVRVHPESGERGLFIGGFAQKIQGFSSSESADLLRMFQSYVTRPENTVRWHWQLGDVAFWDNRSTQHYATYDYDGQLRRVQRVTIAGDVPFGIDGKRSHAIKGNSAAYTPSVAT
ncbi:MULTISPECIES: TauD/TfdA family dioxygenase [unclassified Leptolyngbya]|uniref:TauD/TfdA dioxygenase family protein n=1 Tax=unclassified Leptolyngbya TaxID=2650499 RepID=UPI0016842F27|nr:MULTISPECIES: TauD/TfdA family dioxygenase [unclassified Leptolyngbya]MBD1909884.1 TauD/TfdA family dioxygenase [Leptolyngbya sp. FACHB-8]MBD2158652.1 TauD/TfdA family dioxygenase [Leptolyngbya sp. FACHB-16]